MTDALAIVNPEDYALAAEAATTGDLSKLTAEKRSALYGAICRSIGVNPLTQPFAYIQLNGKLTLYALKGCTDQLRKINGVNIDSVERSVDDGVLTVTVHAHDRHGRSDMDFGSVMVGGLKGEALANATMKALTKAKRRVTLSISGLGFLDESEVEYIGNAQRISVDVSTGEIAEPYAITSGSVQATVDDEAKQAEVQLWSTAKHKYGWNMSILNSVGEFILGSPVAEWDGKAWGIVMSPAGMHDLNTRILGLAPDAWKAIADGSDVASVLTATQESLT